MPAYTPASPYRPTTTRLPEHAVHPKRHSSLFQTISNPSSPRISAPGTPVSIMPQGSNDAVPMLNVIPATPQDGSEDFTTVEHPAVTSPAAPPAVATPPAEYAPDYTSEVAEVEALDEEELDSISLTSEDLEANEDVVSLANMAVRHLDELAASETMDNAPFADFSKPLDLSFNFSPFAPLDLRPSSPIDLSFDYEHREAELHAERERELEREARETPTSPPFESYPTYPSLPSLSSHASDHEEEEREQDQEPTDVVFSHEDNEEIPFDESSEEDSSLSSFNDVEEALGHMLASLSDVQLSDLPELPDVPNLPSLPPTPKVGEVDTASAGVQGNMGLGLGLDLPMEGLRSNAPSSPPARSTAPLVLSPAAHRRRLPPPPLNLAFQRNGNGQSSRLPPAGSASEDDLEKARRERKEMIQPAPTSAPLYSYAHSHAYSYDSGSTSTITPTNTSYFPNQLPVATSSTSPTNTYANGPVSASTFGSRTPGTFDLGSFPSFGSFNVDAWDRSHSSYTTAATNTNTNVASGLNGLTVDVDVHDARGAYDVYTPQAGHKRNESAGDSISLLSEASDEDLHTASIIALTPIVASNGRIERREEAMEGEVGVAF